ncbi:MAG: hypothetical protein KDE09_13470 [Anaerolineales bacterium]|nr:hypothetical protein [Anaerolineales bacterium]MCB0005221.1 hypothetical protein [Anaerolineales bacterium]MCB0018794.1 hypothetical protein [Anaerolineales bacterium]MCB0031027.1 hypothetical protein [Anaerolineales bacterium]
MSHQPAIDELVEALAVLPAYEDPLLPVYETLGPERPLTLRTIRDHSQLLRECTGRAEDQVETIQRVTKRCRQLPPTPLLNLPLGF